MAELNINAGEETEDLLQFVLSQIDDEVLDQIEVDREQVRSHGLASEPVTVAVVLTLGPPLIAGVTNLIGKWMDARAAERQLRLTLAGRGVPPDQAEPLHELGGRTEVSVAVEG